MGLGVDRGVLQLAVQGRLSAVSCLVKGASWPHQCGALKELEFLDIGLHFSLDPPFFRVFWNSLRGRLDRARVEGELERQWDELARQLGREPDFLDSHQHIHQLPGLSSLVLDWLQRHPGCYCRHSAADGLPRGPGAIETLKLWSLALIGRHFRHRLRLRRLPAPPEMVGAELFHGGEEQVWKAYHHHLSRLRPGALWVVHPGLPPWPEDGYRQGREWEYRVLSSRAFGHLLQQHGFRPSRFRECGECG